jgi:hypothetical protein
MYVLIANAKNLLHLCAGIHQNPITMAEELTYIERREWARSEFMREDISNEDLGLKVGTDEATIRKWVREGAWEGMKHSMLTSKRFQLDFFYDALSKLKKKINDSDEINTKDADLVIKYTTAVRNLEIEAPLSQIIEVFELFIRWLRRRDLQLAKDFIVQLDAYVKEKEAA